MILRFMGDMPEPKEAPSSPEGKGETGSGLKKLYGTIKGKFAKPKEEADGGGGGGGEQVRERERKKNENEREREREREGGGREGERVFACMCVVPNITNIFIASW